MESGPPGHEIALRNIKNLLENVCLARARFARSRDRLEKRYQNYWKHYCFGIGNAAKAPCAKQCKTFANSILSEATRGRGIAKVAKTLQIVL